MPNNIAFTRNYTSVIDEVYQRASVSGCLNSGRRMVRAGHNTGMFYGCGRRADLREREVRRAGVRALGRRDGADAPRASRARHLRGGHDVL